MSGLHTSNNTHAQNDRTIRQQREQHKITMMLIVVVIVFLVCQIPQAVANIYLGYVYSKYGDQMPMTMRYRARILGSILNFLVIVNASINFVLYSSFSKKFRRTFRILFCRCCRDKNQPLPLIFSGVSNANDQTRTTRGTASPYTSSPVRHAHSCLSLNVNVNVTTPMPSPTVSVRSTHFIDRKSPRTNRNGYLAVNQMSKVVWAPLPKRHTMSKTYSNVCTPVIVWRVGFDEVKIRQKWRREKIHILLNGSLFLVVCRVVFLVLQTWICFVITYVVWNVWFI